MPLSLYRFVHGTADPDNKAIPKCLRTLLVGEEMLNQIRILGLLSATIVLVLVMQSGIHAASVVIEVKPDATEVHGFKFRIVKEEEQEQNIAFSASISETGAKLSTSPSVALGIVNAKGEMESSQTLQPKRTKEGLLVNFSASKASIEDRRFCLILTNYVEVEVDGKIVPMPSADFFIMRLQDIVKHQDASLAKETAELQRQMETAAKTYSRFATNGILSNRPTDREWPKQLMVEQAKLLADLLKWSKQPQPLRALIGHRDPKVRTLVLGALFVREDPHELPLIASRVSDREVTFTHVHASQNAIGFSGDLTEIEKPQTVGQVAEAMLGRYLNATRVTEDSTFADYWKPRKDLQTCASWILVKVDRATRYSTAEKPEHMRDLERVISQVKRLPPSERTWTQIYLRVTSFADLDKILTDEVCVATLKEIGPDEIIRFLKRERLTSDPDLWFDDLERSNNRVYSWMAHFILRRATTLLRIEDAPALLSCETFQRNTNSETNLGTSPYWAVYAAELVSQNDKASANKTIDDALDRFPLSDILGGRYQAVLMGSLWRINGAKKTQNIVDWIYQAQAKATRDKSDASNHGPLDLLRLVKTSTKPDTEQLMAAIVAAPRFEQADYWTMEGLLEIANDGLPKPLVTQREMSSIWPPGQYENEKAILAEWRAKLITRYHP